MDRLGARTMNVTDITRDGTLTEPNFEMMERLCKLVKADIVASGGQIVAIDRTTLHVFDQASGKPAYSIQAPFGMAPVPILTEERRRELAKQAKSEAELTKVSIRNDRKDGNTELKKLDISEDMRANAEVDIQELTDKYSKKVDEMFEVKEKEIMTV